MKKILSVAAIVLVALMTVTACAPKTVEEDRHTFTLGGLKGPTSMGLAPLVSDALEGKEAFDVEFDLVASPEEIVPKIVRGDCELAALPANLASTLYNKTEGGIVTLAINTLGVLDIVENGHTVHALSDLSGRTLYASGEGAVPEYVIRLLLERSGIDPDRDVTIEWMAEHGAIVAQLLAEPGAVGLLPQPFVTVAMKQNAELRLALDLNDDWIRLVPEAGLVMGVLVAQKETVEQHPEAVDAFLKRYREAIQFTNDHPGETSRMVEALDVFDAKISEAAIPYCNIHYADGDAMKQQLKGFLELLSSMNPQAIGGNMPADDFYYRAK